MELCILLKYILLVVMLILNYNLAYQRVGNNGCRCMQNSVYSLALFLLFRKMTSFPCTHVQVPILTEVSITATRNNRS